MTTFGLMPNLHADITFTVTWKRKILMLLLLLLLLLVGMWAYLGRVIYEAEERASAVSEDGRSGITLVHVRHKRVRAVVPDTVPSGWIAAYQAENGE
jgi:hypothetical protein